MLIGVLSSSADGIPIVSYYIKGPIMKIGRNIDSDICINDRSISRSHGEIHMNDKTFAIIDFGSKYGTFLPRRDNQNKIKANEEICFQIGEPVRLGINMTFTLSYQSMSLNFTRLERKAKDQLKKIAFKIDANILNNVEDASYLVTDKFSATIKMLTAIIINKPVITMDWFSFIETKKSCELIPPVSK
jgi:pSer/pThr/pTyr-binding forkhead associated (FHA) protein